VSTPAIVLSAMRYRESSKIVRLATLDLGVQSVIAKGALRPRSRFGAALQLLSEGTAMFTFREHRELHTLTAFDQSVLHLGLANDLAKFAAGSVVAELMLRFAPADRHPESFELVRHTLEFLEAAPTEAVETIALRSMWQLVGVLGFTPTLSHCVRDGNDLPVDGPVEFSPADGGVLCRTCAPAEGTRTLPEAARRDLRSLIDPSAEWPLLDERHAAAHRRLFAHYVEYHLAEGRPLPAMRFWLGRSWITS
jgi:DNA repair protein RecO (recombination protein O)